MLAHLVPCYHVLQATLDATAAALPDPLLPLLLQVTCITASGMAAGPYRPDCLIVSCTQPGVLPPEGHAVYTFLALCSLGHGG